MWAFGELLVGLWWAIASIKFKKTKQSCRSSHNECCSAILAVSTIASVEGTLTRKEARELLKCQAIPVPKWWGPLLWSL